MGARSSGLVLACACAWLSASATGVALAPPACACFSFCNMSETAHAFAALPIVRTRASPWYPLLRSVYNGSVPLPFDMATMGALLLPTSAAHGALRVPWSTRCARATPGGPKYGAAPRCELGVCVRLGWYDGARARHAEGVLTLPQRAELHGKDARLLHSGTVSLPAQPRRRAAGANGSSAEPPAAVLGSMALYGNANIRARANPPKSLQPYAVLRWHTPRGRLRHAAPNGSWVEVLRQAMDLPEGIAYGCWFWLLLPPYPRGTGTYVNVGRTLAFSGRYEASKYCGARGYHRLYSYPAELGSAPDAIRLKANSVKPNDPALDQLGRQNDNALGVCARGLGFDSVQLVRGLAGRSELVMAPPECTVPGQREKLGSCPPTAVELRTGWGGAQPCHCAEAVELVPPQAGGGAAAAPAALSAAQRRRWAEPATLPLGMLNCLGAPAAAGRRGKGTVVRVDEGAAAAAAAATADAALASGDATFGGDINNSSSGSGGPALGDPRAPALSLLSTRACSNS